MYKLRSKFLNRKNKACILHLTTQKIEFCNDIQDHGTSIYTDKLALFGEKNECGKSYVDGCLLLFECSKLPACFSRDSTVKVGSTVKSLEKYL